MPSTKIVNMDMDSGYPESYPAGRTGRPAILVVTNYHYESYEGNGHAYVLDETLDVHLVNLGHCSCNDGWDDSLVKPGMYLSSFYLMVLDEKVNYDTLPDLPLARRFLEEIRQWIADSIHKPIVTT